MRCTRLLAAILLFAAVASEVEAVGLDQNRFSYVFWYDNSLLVPDYVLAKDSDNYYNAVTGLSGSEAGSWGLPSANLVLPLAGTNTPIIIVSPSGRAYFAASYWGALTPENDAFRDHVNTYTSTRVYPPGFESSQYPSTPSYETLHASGLNSQGYYNGEGVVWTTALLLPKSGVWETDRYQYAWWIYGQGEVGSTILGLSLAPCAFTLDYPETAAVPEPSSIVVWSSLGVVGLVMLWRSRKQRAA